MSQPTGKKQLAGLCLGLAAIAAFSLNGLGAAHAAEGAILKAGAPDTIKDSYIVALKGETSLSAGTRLTVGSDADRLTDRYGGQVGLVYSAALRGFSVRMTEAQAKRLAADPMVSYVEQNAVARLVETWGLDRVDQRDLPLSNSYSAPNDGANATAYVVDTGVYRQHPDFGGRVTSGRDFIDNDDDASDCHGHGTHVAGTVGSATWGVAKKVKLVAVRVLNCSGQGSWDQVIGGIDWVTQNAPQAAIGNMSLAGPKTQSVNDAVARSTGAGVAWAIAAGNEGSDACTRSPASAPSALTAAASDRNDARASFSNYGSCVDLFAPGVSITSTKNSGGQTDMSGTSMASPHVAGAAALVLSANPGASVSEVNSKIVDTATPGKISSPNGSPNKLLYVKDLGGGPTDPQAPQAAFTANCSTTAPSCSFDAAASRDPDGSIASYSWKFGDNQTGTGINPSHTYNTAGTYTVELTVTDNAGKTDTETKQVTAGKPPTTGQPPRASFTAQCQWAACSFNGNGSTDPDNDIATYTWTYGDGQTGTGVTSTHSYPNRQATYTAQLKVTDRAGNTNTASRQIQCWSVGSQAFCFGQ